MISPPGMDGVSLITRYDSIGMPDEYSTAGAAYPP
jgi:hypothetical protein